MKAAFSSLLGGRSTSLDSAVAGGRRVRRILNSQVEPGSAQEFGLGEPVEGAREAQNTEIENLGGVRFAAGQFESQAALSKVIFHRIINDELNLAQEFYSRIAIAKVEASSKRAVIFADQANVTDSDIKAVVELLRSGGFELVDTEVQGYFAISHLVISLSQGHLNSTRLSAERNITRDPQKNSLYTSFRDIVAWGLSKDANDVDFVIDDTSPRSQLGFKIAGEYIRPKRYSVPTQIVKQMLGVAWQLTEGGDSAAFESKQEQQALMFLELPKDEANPTGARIRLRWSGMPNDRGTVITCRIQRLGETAKIKSVSDSGYLPNQVRQIHRASHSRGGMVVFAGTVGSGKTTTLANIISGLPDRRKIISIEDPVELDIQNTFQKTVPRDLLATGPEAALVSATRAIFRSALDDLFLGEIRDREMGLIARQVADSGHNVYTTTHAKSGLGIFDRFASPSIGIPRDVLATPGFVKLLAFQALLPVTCPHCGRTPEDHAAALDLKGDLLGEHKRYFERLEGLYGISANSYRLRNPDGCSECCMEELPELNGLLGRTVVAEIIEPDEQLLLYVRDSKNIEAFRYWRSLSDGVFTSEDMLGKTAMECAVYKAAKGLIDPRDIEAYFKSFETVEMERNVANGKRAREAEIA